MRPHPTAVPLLPQINAGKLVEARDLLDGVISDDPRDVSARVARGTARALLRELDGAVEDFSAAIEAEPRWVGVYVWGGDCSGGCWEARLRSAGRLPSWQVTLGT